MKKLIHIIARVALLYLIAFGVIYLITDMDTAINKTRLATLNRLRLENYQSLYELSQGKTEVDRDALDKHELYFRKVSQYIPRRADAHGMHGFCLYYQGREAKAINAYERSREINAQFFWYHYNLGAIYFNDKDYPKAVDALKIALSLDPKLTYAFILQSQRIYLPILLSQSDDIKSLIQKQYRHARRESFRMLYVSLDESKQYEELLSVAIRAIQSREENEGEAFYYAGVAAYHLKNYERAIAFMRERLKRKEADSKAVEFVGRSLIAIGKKEMGELTLQRAKAITQLHGSGEDSHRKVPLGLY